MTKQRPSVSIVYAVENATIDSADSLRSIIGQTLQDCEILVTGLLVNKLAGKIDVGNKQIHFINTKANAGVYGSFNKGMQHATGTYLCFVNPNEFSAQTRLESQVEVLKGSRLLGCIGSALEHQQDYVNLPVTHMPPLKDADIRIGFLKSNSLILSTALFRSAWLEKYNLRFDVSRGQAAAYEFITRCSENFKLGNREDVLVTVKNQHYGDATVRRKRKKNFDQLRLHLLSRLKPSLTTAEKKLHLALMNDEYLSDEELDNAIEWANTLLGENYKKNIYPHKQLLRFFETQIQNSVHRNNLGGWSIEKGLLNFISTLIKPGERILEFGSGEGTGVLLKKYKVTSIEHDINFAYQRDGDHTCLHAPLTEGWYDAAIVKKALKEEYDLVLVDGPPRETRANIVKYAALFRQHKMTVIFDDMDRQADKAAMIAFCEKLGYSYTIMQGTSKQFALCTKITGKTQTTRKS
ncbi:MAG: glycosyltransferase [Bacteroidota bacterium]